MADSRKYDLDLIFQALAHPSRRAMLKLVSNEEQSIGDIAKPFRDMSLAAASKHIQVLERAKLINRRKSGNSHLISLNAVAMKSADQWMEYYRRYWDDRLDLLKELLEKEDQ